MRFAKHLTDEVLKQIIENDQFETEQSGIDTHISDCAECRARLESLADSGWMTFHRNSLKQEYENESHSHLQLDELLDTLAPTSRNLVADQGRDFELLAIKQMLDEILLPPTHPEMMGRLGGYEVEEIIGYGGMGIVLRAHDRELQRPVAIKLIVPRLAKDGTVKQRFAREARAAAAILHPNVIAIHGIDETNDMPWFVMPLINGPSLRELVEKNGPLHESDIVRIGLQIASGLASAHSHGVIHRDIKPENILVDNQINRVVITDFGLARQQFDATLTQTGILAGTLNYMSPEQARGHNVDPRSDLFSLGALMYFLATGRAPFRSDSPGNVIHKILNEKQQDIRAINPELSHSLSRTIDALLEKEPENRFQSAFELEAYLAQLVSHLNQPTINALPRLPVTKRNHYSKWFAIAAVSILSISVAFVYWLNRNNPRTPTAKEFWQEVQLRYELESPDEFSENMKTLDESIARLSRDFDRFNSGIDDEFLGHISRFARDIERMSQQIDVGSTDDFGD